MKIYTALWFVPLLTLGFAARSDSGIKPGFVGDEQAVSSASRRLVVENAMLHARLEQVQDALDDASDKIEAAQQLLSIEGEPAALEYAASQLDGALRALDDASEATDATLDTDDMLQTSFHTAARPRAHRFWSRGTSQIVRLRDSAHLSHSHGTSANVARSNHEHV